MSHRQRALALEQSAIEAMQEGTRFFSSEGMVAITLNLAQLHATLELAEQQKRTADEARTANLIAYAAHRIDHPDATQARVKTMITMLGSLDFEIREALEIRADAVVVDGAVV